MMTEIGLSRISDVSLSRNIPVKIPNNKRRVVEDANDVDDKTKRRLG